MRIEDYEFEELKTQSEVADLLISIGEQIKQGKKLELPMPTLREGIIEIPLNEPIEAGLEVSLRKFFTHVTITLSWEKFREREDEQSE